VKFIPVKLDGDARIAEKGAMPDLMPPTPTPHARAAWRTWLGALAVDAEVALAAALTYESLDDAARDAFLDAIDEDAAIIDAPKIALFAPFLAVENETRRRDRLSKAIASDPRVDVRRAPRALFGNVDGEQLTVLLLPLYLGFVEVLACRWSHHAGCISAEHEPLRTARDFQRAQSFDGVALEEMAFDEAIEDLAHAIVTSVRRDGHPPDALIPFADLFSLRAAHASV
jgi:hypothetical protein